MSNDDSLSAGELRHRYHAGGSVPDSELTASQLRARHGVQGNNFDHSREDANNTSGGSSILAVVAAVVILGVIAVFVFLKKSNNGNAIAS